MDDRTGSQLGNYRIIRLLGEGGFARVYLAEHLYQNTPAALKIMQARLGEADLQLFLSEAQTIARLLHPHIARVLDVGVEGSAPFVVMDYAPNGTLRERHRRGIPLEPAFILPYVKQVGEALHYAHENKLIHRNIKPENMLLGQNQEVLLSDFGVGKFVQPAAAYAAPEQLQGNPVPASDQYSLAVVVYEWLAGDVPFQGSSPEVANQQVMMPPPPLRARVPGIPPLVEQVVLTALGKTPAQRFGSVDAFVRALEQAIQSAPTAVAGYDAVVDPATPTMRMPQEQPPTPSAPMYFAQTQLTPPTPGSIPSQPEGSGFAGAAASTPIVPPPPEGSTPMEQDSLIPPPPPPPMGSGPAWGSGQYSTPGQGAPMSQYGPPAGPYGSGGPGQYGSGGLPPGQYGPPGQGAPPGQYGPPGQSAPPGQYGYGMQSAPPGQYGYGGLPPGPPDTARQPMFPAAPPPKRSRTALFVALALVVVLVVVAGGGFVFLTHMPHSGRVATSTPTGVATSTPTATPTAAPNLAPTQVLTLANIGVQDVKTLDPALVTDTNSAQALTLIFSGLVNLDVNTQQVVPDLATSWDISSDGKAYTFHLRSGLKFSNGDPLTAADVAYSIDRAFDPSLDGVSGTASYYLGVNDVPDIVGAADRAAGKAPTIIGTGLVAVDDLTLQIHLTQPVAYFLDELTYPVSWVVDKNVVNQYGANWSDGHAVGSGPFLLQSWDHDVQLTFLSNPNWYGPQSHLTEIDMPLFPSSTTAYEAYQAGQIAVDDNLDATTYATLKSAGGSGQLFDGPNLSTYYLAPNSKIAPFNNVTVRQAFAEAVDRETIASTIEGGTVISTDHIVPQGTPGYYANLKGLPFNPTDARAKLASVYPDVSKMPAITLEYSTGGDKIAAKVMQDYETYLGVTITLKVVDFNTLLNDVFTKNAAGIYPVQFYMLGWIMDYPDASDVLDQLVTGSPNNTMNFSNAQVDSMVAQADSLQDLNQRDALYNQAEELAADNVAWIPYGQGKNIYIIQNDVHGFVVGANGLIPPSVWANVYLCNGSC